MKKSELYSLLWEACNKLRGGVEPSRYKDYVLVLLFFKYVSDRYKGQPFAEFTVSQGASFDDLIAAKGRSDIGERVDKILQKFLEDNRLQGALPDVSFNNREELGSGKELVLSLIHISEPTRRTPISYAVFCLKKKKQQKRKKKKC